MLIHSNWKGIKAAIETTANLVNSFGINRDTLTSANALIPIIYFLYKHPGTTLLGGNQFEVKNASLIRIWLLMALLNNIFSGQSDRALSDTRRALEQSQDGEDFPVDAIIAELKRSARKASFDDDTIDTILSLSYGKSLTFLALSLLYDQNNWGNLTYHQDHIFPQALFTSKNLSSVCSTIDQQKRYWDAMNRVGNLQLLLPGENLEKSNKDFEQWLATRDTSFRKRHLIPDDDRLLKFDNFEKFIVAREELICERLKHILSTAQQEKVGLY